jgi:hypothetical protein
MSLYEFSIAPKEPIVIKFTKTAEAILSDYAKALSKGIDLLEKKPFVSILAVVIVCVGLLAACWLYLNVQNKTSAPTGANTVQSSGNQNQVVGTNSGNVSQTNK